MTPSVSGPGPQREPSDLDEQPVVGVKPGRSGLIAAMLGLATLAVVLFLVLNARRTQSADGALPVADGQAVAANAPPPLNLPPPPPPEPPPAPIAVLPPLPSVVSTPPVTAGNEVTQRLRAPAVVVDLQPGGGIIPAVATTGTNAASMAPVKPADVPKTGAIAVAAEGSAMPASSLLGGPTAGSGLGANEQFATRVSGVLPEPAIATQLSGLGTTITQGATIAAVLETAVNSDLPGYARAVVSRDVHSFDGKAVLIPRGSRLIGQYRSALSLGQERVFVIWTRVIRPDGVSIQIGSPGADALGQGGMSGDVNTHFFARFGSSILLSVLNGGIAAIAGTPSTQISIGSPAAAAGAAATAVPASGDIMPTIKVKQGVVINIFVARDLDFSAVKPVQ